MACANGFYPFLDRLGWPRSYAGKFLLVAFVATHLPLISLSLVLVSWRHTVAIPAALLILLLATLAGTLLSFLAFLHLLRPILTVRAQLSTYLETRRLPTLPTHFRDEAGGLLRDIDAAIQALHSHATIDHLTQLPNRRDGERQLQECLAVAELGQEPAFSVGLVDVDHFKAINDRFGHRVGDDVLVQLAHVLTETLGPEGRIARWGGEEFLVIVPVGLSDATARFEYLRRAIPERVCAPPGGSVRVTVSIGAAGLFCGDTIDSVVARADKALYRAKSSGRNRIET